MNKTKFSNLLINLRLINIINNFRNCTNTKRKNLKKEIKSKKEVQSY